MDWRTTCSVFRLTNVCHRCASGPLPTGALLRGDEERTDATTDTAPARLVRGNNHWLIEGSVGDATSSNTNPPATLTTRESGPPPDGQRPRHATATSSPSPAAAIGSSSSSRSEAIAHGAWELSRSSRFELRRARVVRAPVPLHHQPVWPPCHLRHHRSCPRRSQLSSTRASRSARLLMKPSNSRPSATAPSSDVGARARGVLCPGHLADQDAVVGLDHSSTRPWCACQHRRRRPRDTRCRQRSASRQNAPSAVRIRRRP